MSRVAITGLHGEIGNSLAKGMKREWEVIDLSHSTSKARYEGITQIPIDLLLPKNIEQALEKAQPSIIVHLAGATHIDTCEADKVHGTQGKVWRMNVTATDVIADYCVRQAAHLIYLSTECVFDGKKDAYTESDALNPINWYGKTKAAAEAVIAESGCSFTIFRAVITYSPEARNTLWQKIDSTLKANDRLVMASDHWMTPSYLPDISKTICNCIEKQQNGVFHIAPSLAETPYSFALKIASKIGYSAAMIEAKPLAEIIGIERSRLRLQHACLDATHSSRQLKTRFHTLDQVLEKL